MIGAMLVTMQARASLLTVSEVSRDVISISAPDKKEESAKFVLPISIALFENAGWDLQDLRERLRAAQNIYLTQCQIEMRLEHVYLVTTGQQSLLNVGLQYHERIIGRELENLPRPLYVYTESYQPVVQIQPRNGFTCSKSFDCQRGEENLIWIFKTGANYYKSKPDFYSADFSIEAHEMAHLLGDLPHVESTEHHILSQQGFNNTIPPSFCERFQQSPLLRPL
jgi:hypothetical protein